MGKNREKALAEVERLEKIDGLIGCNDLNEFVDAIEKRFDDEDAQADGVVGVMTWSACALCENRNMKYQNPPCQLDFDDVDLVNDGATSKCQDFRRDESVLFSKEPKPGFAAKFRTRSDDKKPLPPHILADAKQGVCHKEIGKGRAAKSVKVAKGKK